MMAASEHYRARICPVAGEGSRPCWSVMIPTYNCAAYLRTTLASVLAQDPGPERMQIEVVDDCSTADDPAAVVEELGGGRVGFYQQPRNLGHVGNLNACLQRSRGRLIHLLHGDDQVRPGFYETLECAFEEAPDIGAAFCRGIVMNDLGHWMSVARLEEPMTGVLGNWLERIASGQRVLTPAMVVRRDVYECLGGFDRRIRYCGEDWEMWVRIAAHYPVSYVIEPLAVYRVHPSSLSSHSVRTGANMVDMRQVIEINRSVLPSHLADRVTADARKNCALDALKTARRLFRGGHARAAFTQLWQALKTSRSPAVLARGIRLVISSPLQRIRNIQQEPKHHGRY